MAEKRFREPILSPTKRSLGVRSHFLAVPRYVHEPDGPVQPLPEELADVLGVVAEPKCRSISMVTCGNRAVSIQFAGGKVELNTTPLFSGASLAASTSSGIPYREEKRKN